MNTHDIDIELPQLHRPQVPLIDADIDLMDIRRLADWCEKTAKEYARAAVEADRQRRGEPTAAEISDVIREITGCPDIKNGEDSLVVALGMLFHRGATTQPSEPVKVPSNDLAHEIWAAAQTAPGEGIEDAVERVAALLARYGKGAP